MQKIERRLKRKKRVRSKVTGSASKPRLSVFRSNQHLFVQLIDDEKGVTIVSASDTELGKDVKVKKVKSGLVGELLAKKALAKKIKKIVFDRNGYRYHGRIKDFADGVRLGGLEF